jgi:hypothetical protein
MKDPVIPVATQLEAPSKLTGDPVTGFPAWKSCEEARVKIEHDRNTLVGSLAFPHQMKNGGEVQRRLRYQLFEPTVDP